MRQPHGWVRLRKGPARRHHLALYPYTSQPHGWVRLRKGPNRLPFAVRICVALRFPKVNPVCTVSGLSAFSVAGIRSRPG
eukprot:2424131-Pyramimonas_sp.AAC.1